MVCGEGCLMLTKDPRAAWEPQERSHLHLGHHSPHSRDHLGSELLPAFRGRAWPSHTQWAPARGLPVLWSGHSPRSPWCLHLCATGLLNRPCSSFSAYSPSSSSPGTRSSSLAGPASSPLGETLGTHGMEFNREDSGLGRWS